MKATLTNIIRLNLLLMIIMQLTYGANENLCTGVTITSTGSVDNDDKATDGDIPGDCSIDDCMSINAGGEITIDFGSIQAISTIVFVASSPDGATGGGVRSYGTDSSITGPNTVISQEGNTNYAGSVADINNGSKENIQYIHWRNTRTSTITVK